jgi:tRNA-specific 2-thiouridylase
VATGHHARIGRSAAGGYTLERGADAAKDQSYVVHMLGQGALARTLFPVGHLDKAEVRRLAAVRGLRTASKPDSQDVCFITSDGGRTAFLGERIAFRPGRVVDRDGAALGEVSAIETVTIGQRRGIGLPGGGPKRYVVDVDTAAGVVVVGGHDELVRPHVDVEAVSWVDGPVAGAVRVQASAHGVAVPATIEPVAGAAHTVRATWESPQRRIAPGQSVVVYDADDRCVLGGGVAAR